MMKKTQNNAVCQEGLENARWIEQPRTSCDLREISFVGVLEAEARL